MNESLRRKCELISQSTSPPQALATFISQLKSTQKQLEAPLLLFSLFQYLVNLEISEDRLT